jgi:hypothetical protein
MRGGAGLDHELGDHTMKGRLIVVS